MIAETPDTIDTAGGNRPRPSFSCAEAVPALIDMPTKPELLSILVGLINDEGKLRQVASLSYRHQLGFEKFVLRAFPSGACLRLHHWDRGARGEEDVHSHCASFISKLWLGALHQQTFRLVAGATHVAFHYRFNNTTGESEATAGALTGVVSDPASSLCAGDSYTMEAETLHRISGAAPGTVTVSSWGPRFHDAVVLKPSKEGCAPSCARAGMEMTHVYDRLKEIHRRLAAT